MMANHGGRDIWTDGSQPSVGDTARIVFVAINRLVSGINRLDCRSLL